VRRCDSYSQAKIISCHSLCQIRCSVSPAQTLQLICRYGHNSSKTCTGRSKPRSKPRAPDTMSPSGPDSATVGLQTATVLRRNSAKLTDARHIVPEAFSPILAGCGRPPQAATRQDARLRVSSDWHGNGKCLTASTDVAASTSPTLREPQAARRRLMRTPPATQT
jgi:hypothetical protein